MGSYLTAQTEFGTFSYWPNDLIGKSIAEGNVWEPFLKPAFDELGPESCVIDVGANIGWFTIYAAKRGAYVYAFEPCLEVFRLLKLNVEQNNLREQVSLFPFPVSERLEYLVVDPLGPENTMANQAFQNGKLVTDVCGNSGSMQLRRGDPDQPGQWAVSLDDMGFMQIDLIKVDTEGMDLEILKGAQQIIASELPTLCYEYLGENPDVDPARLNAFNAFIEGIGYQAEQVHVGMDGQYREFIARPK